MLEDALRRIIPRGSRAGRWSDALVAAGRLFGEGRRARLLTRLGYLGTGHAEFVAALDATRPPASAVERPASLDEASFLARHARPGAPVVLQGATSGWPASGWTLPGLGDALGDLTLEVRRGRDYDSLTTAKTTLPSYLAALSSGWYLANNVLPERLWEQVGLPPYFPREKFRRELARLWVGGPGTGAHLHRDLTDNFLVQLVGHKRILLCPPWQSRSLYYWEVHDQLHSSKVDAARPDPTRHPLATRVRFVDVVLGPGDMLYLPCGWFHQVESLDATCSVNFFLHNSVAALPEWDGRWPITPRRR
jgi:hypothetical protein